MSATTIDHLEEDFTTIPNQRYVLVSFVGPNSSQKSEQCGMKIRGAFATEEEAAAHVKRLQKEDTTFDVFMLEMYKWVCIPPSIEKIDDVRYQEEYLQTLISGYKQSQEEAKQHFNERKKAVLEQGLDVNLNENEKIALPEDPHPSVASGST